MRNPILYLIAHIPIIILSLIFSYFSYRRKAKKYVKIFKKTLIKNGIQRKTAKKLSNEIKIMSLGDMLKLMQRKSF